jgi:hypothetical protein
VAKKTAPARRAGKTHNKYTRRFAAGVNNFAMKALEFQLWNFFLKF